MKTNDKVHLENDRIIFTLNTTDYDITNYTQELIQELEKLKG